MSSGDGAELSGRRRASRLAHFFAQSLVIEEIQPTAALASGGMSVREATERIWTKSSLASCRLKARIDMPVRPLS